MNRFSSNFTSRREFLKHSGKLAAVSTAVLPLLAGRATAQAANNPPVVHPGEDNTLRLALVGGGGRGSGRKDGKPL
ncbi:MAG: hypothetical protein MUF81_03430 [Verrucomicrobia bacterium]|jgi:hypothetical protein|nr:hypothetical protein [Verrucomicrobiota bacterium]